VTGGLDEPELAHLERARLRALVEHDLDTADALHSDDYELITPGGVVLSRAAYLDAIAAGDLRYDVFEPSGPIRARVHEDSAIVRYRARVDVTWEGGSDVAELWHTDYWERRDERWQAVWSHATQTSAGSD
jgi:hypothetical protein